VVYVENEQVASRLHFVGSPTVRVDGLDVDPAANALDTYGLRCRVYDVGGHVDGAPPSTWIEAALRKPESPTGSPLGHGHC
jgi:hypothetical protein